jgi:hypothetical protein
MEIVKLHPNFGLLMTKLQGNALSSRHMRPSHSKKLLLEELPELFGSLKSATSAQRQRKPSAIMKRPINGAKMKVDHAEGKHSSMPDIGRSASCSGTLTTSTAIIKLGDIPVQPELAVVHES